MSSRPLPDRFPEFLYRVPEPETVGPSSIDARLADKQRSAGTSGLTVQLQWLIIAVMFGFILIMALIIQQDHVINARLDEMKIRLAHGEVNAGVAPPPLRSRL